jgi:hypothetical protein
MTNMPTVPVNLAGATFRLVLQFVEGAQRGVPNPVDVGWRIGGISVQDGRSFARDLEVASVRPVADLYDPATTGVAPNAPLPVMVTLHDSGRLAVGQVQVRVTGTDVEASGGAAVLCNVSQSLGRRLLPG